MKLFMCITYTFVCCLDVRKWMWNMNALMRVSDEFGIYMFLWLGEVISVNIVHYSWSKPPMGTALGGELSLSLCLSHSFSLSFALSLSLCLSPPLPSLTSPKAKTGSIKNIWIYLMEWKIGENGGSFPTGISFPPYSFHIFNTRPYSPWLVTTRLFARRKEKHLHAAGVLEALAT